MRYFLILILIASSWFVFSESAFAYHGEQEQLEMSQMTGIFSSEMKLVMYPLVGEEYNLQIVLRDESQYENSTMTVGYGFNLIERVPNKLSPESVKPFMGFESTHSTSANKDSQTIQTSQYEFPLIVNFTVAFEKPGVHHYSYYEHMTEPGKNTKLIPLAKHDFSTLVCVTPETHHELITRGWAPLP